MADPVADVCAILEGAAEQEYIGEPISQLAHALQAADLAVHARADDELVIAALLHDIGHLCAAPGTPSMAGLGIVHHEQLGADYLRSLGFSERVASLVSGHVDAKRYLVTRTTGYLDRLSDASRQTLQWQGGPMDEDEAARFRASPLFADVLRLRAWDEAAKVPDLTVPTLISHRDRLLRNVNRAP